MVPINLTWWGEIGCVFDLTAAANNWWKRVQFETIDFENVVGTWNKMNTNTSFSLADALFLKYLSHSNLSYWL